MKPGTKKKRVHPAIQEAEAKLYKALTIQLVAIVRSMLEEIREEEGDVVYPTYKEQLNKARGDDSQCTICPPNRGENAQRKPKHKAKPKKRNKR